MFLYFKVHRTRFNNGFKNVNTKLVALLFIVPEEDDMSVSIWWYYLIYLLDLYNGDGDPPHVYLMN